MSKMNIIVALIVWTVFVSFMTTIIDSLAATVNHERCYTVEAKYFHIDLEGCKPK